MIDDEERASIDRDFVPYDAKRNLHQLVQLQCRIEQPAGFEEPLQSSYILGDGHVLIHICRWQTKVRPITLSAGHLECYRNVRKGVTSDRDPRRNFTARLLMRRERGFRFRRSGRLRSTWSSLTGL